MEGKFCEFIAKMRNKYPINKKEFSKQLDILTSLI